RLAQKCSHRSSGKRKRRRYGTFLAGICIFRHVQERIRTQRPIHRACKSSMIGIFDSGVGGLTVLHAIRQNLPSADVLYFGDTKNAPYGEKSREKLSDLTTANIKFLLEHGATNIVSACNSVSASLAISLFDAFDLKPQQLIEMVGPTVS